MKTTKVLYWTFTGLFAFMMGGSAIPDLLMAPEAVAGIHGEFGYPVYFVPFLGVAKLLGVVAILTPGFPRLKEWAYAGLTFDLIGATYSLISVGKPVSIWVFMALPIGLAAGSYLFYHKRREALTTAGSVQVAALV
jgi:hypothetical protein